MGNLQIYPPLFNMAVDFKAVAEQFCSFYYQTFSQNRSQLTAMYGEKSCMTFEGDQLFGKAEIVNKLSRLSFQKVEHKITKIDSQPILDVDDSKAVMVSVIGKLMTDDDPEKGFHQVFVLRPIDGSGY